MLTVFPYIPLVYPRKSLKKRHVLESYKPLSTCCNIERGPESSDLPWLTYVILRGHWPCVCILVPTNHPLCPGISSILLICKTKAWLELIWYAVKNLISFRGSSAENIKSIDQCKKQILHHKKFFFSSCQMSTINYNICVRYEVQHRYTLNIKHIMAFTMTRQWYQFPFP